MKKSIKLILVILLIIVCIAMRLQNEHQTDPDSYWLYGQAESIQLEKSALWVFHPASLFGYYPLSYPSGTMFFLATFSTLTGLSMLHTVYATSILVGLLITFLTFMIARRLFNSWKTAYLAAFIVSASPIMINYTSFNAGGRVFVMLFYLLFVWTLLKFEEGFSWKYLILLITTFIFAAFTHRTSQLLIVFVIASIATLLYFKLPKIWEYVGRMHILKKLFHNRYTKNKYKIIFDVLILIILFVALKLTDLIRRGRLDENINTRLIQPATEFYATVSGNMTIFIIIGAVLLLIIAGFILYLSLIRKKKIYHSTKNWFKGHYENVFHNPDKYLSILLFLAFLYMFLKQFLGESFYSPSIETYTETTFFSGTSPIIIFANFIVNYSTSVTPVFIFFFIGIVFLIFKKKKEKLDWFIIISTIGFSGLLLDKSYIRLFLVPIIAIITSYGIMRIYNLIAKDHTTKLIRKILRIVFILLVFILLIGGLFIPQIRTMLGTEQDHFKDVEYYWATGDFIKAQDCKCSTVTTGESIAGLSIFASSGVPGGSHNIYYFVDKENINVKAISFENIKNNFLSGSKIDRFWVLPDWILGGNYYIGRHAIHLFKSPFYEKKTAQIIETYNEEYYIHDKMLEENVFLNSIKDIKNIVYDNPKSTVYHLEKGRE